MKKSFNDRHDRSIYVGISSKPRLFLKIWVSGVPILFLKKTSTNFGVCTECTDLGYTRLGPKNHIFGCNLHNFSKSNEYLFMANLKSSVCEDSRGVLTFCWRIKIAWMATFRTLSTLVKKPSQNLGLKINSSKCEKELQWQAW